MCLGPDKLGAAVIPKTDYAAETDNKFANTISGTDTPWWKQDATDPNISPKSKQMLTARLNLTKK